MKNMSKKDISFLKQPNHTGILEPDIDKEECIENKKMGRPSKKVEEKKTESVKVYLTVQEKKKLEKSADLGSGVSISLGQLIRKALIEQDMI